MNLIGIFLLAIGVAMDAFAVSLCKGITIKEHVNKKATIVGLWFGAFQGIMPLIGFFFMDNVEKYLSVVKEYIIFGLLLYIGIAMIIESFKAEDINPSLSFKEMFVLSLATSLDAFSVGMTISLMGVNVFLSTSIIALVTFGLCYVAVGIGYKFGLKYKSKAEIIGGIILISIGLNIILKYLILK